MRFGASHCWQGKSPLAGRARGPLGGGGMGRRPLGGGRRGGGGGGGQDYRYRHQAARRPRERVTELSWVVAAAAGSSSTKVAPLADGASRKVPPFCSASSRAIDRPKPLPPDDATPARKSCLRTLAGRPGPPSATRNTMPAAGGSTVRSTVLSLPRARATEAALCSRLNRMRNSWSASAATGN